MNEALRDTLLQERVETARHRTLDWLAGMQAPGLPRGVARISAAHDVGSWPSMLLPGTYNAVMCLDLIGGLDDYDAVERAALADWIEGFRRPDGVFRLPQMTDEAVFKKPDRDETWRYIDFHVTNYSLGAVQALAPERRAVLVFAAPYLDPLTLKAWLADRDLRDPWQEGNNIVNLASFFLLMREAGERVAEVDRALGILFDWHDRLQEPETGFWGVGQGMDPIRRLHAMAGSMHNFHIWYRLGRPLPYQRRAVDYALSRPTGIDTACIDVDLVDLLVHADGLIGHRRLDTMAWLRAKLEALLALQGADGGFMDEATGTRRQDGWVAGYEESQGLSNTFATWFRWIAIAMIADRLWPGRREWRFRRMIGIGYRVACRAVTTVPPNEPVDPFEHLHREDYARPFDGKRATADTMIFMGGRTRLPLDGDWAFTTDLFDEGLRQAWFADPVDDPAGWKTPRDHDPDGLHRVPVPSCWTCLRPEWAHFEGGAWYMRDLDVPDPAPGERLYLRVGAANYAARVFFGGEFLASHRGGSTPFFVELKRGRGRLMIQVDNRRAADRVPMHHFDWFNHGGLYREVDLVRVPAVHIADFGLALAPSGRGERLRADVTISAAVDGTARLLIPALDVTIDVPVANGRGAVEFEAKPQLWQPGTPVLYDVSLGFGADRVADRVGFRDIRRDGTRLLLNGRDIALRGVCVHEDDLVLGKATSEADIRRRFADAAALGANCLRLAHYPHHERVAEIADEVGMMLWSEIPVYWAIDFANPDTYADAENQLAELIRRDRNRASTIIWGVGNENADTDARYRFMAGLAGRARMLDPTRLVAAACLINRRTFRIEDRLADHLDLIGLNEYFGWYEPDFTGLERLLANSSPDRPVVISETGADALAGKRGPTSELFTEDRQAELFRRQLAIIEDVAYIRGFFPWLLYDFRSERRQTRFQRGFNRKGLIAEDKATRKLAFGVIAARYRDMAEDTAEDWAI